MKKASHFEYVTVSKSQEELNLFDPAAAAATDILVLSWNEIDASQVFHISRTSPKKLLKKYDKKIKEACICQGQENLLQFKMLQYLR